MSERSHSGLMRAAAAWLVALIWVGSAGRLPGQEADRPRDQGQERGMFALDPTSPVWAMIERQLRSRGIRDPGVLRVMRAVPREKFVPQELRNRAYDDRPLPIGYGQTISQPFIVAFMTEQLQPNKAQRVLEIGRLGLPGSCALGSGGGGLHN